METTLSLRNRLGFNEVAIWKQFCARRLHLIHTLSLNLRKASEQEEQVRVLAAELCAEYGFGPYAQSDFEKLLIAGIQSVRRNKKRSARHPNGFEERKRSDDPALAGPGPLAYPQSQLSQPDVSIAHAGHIGHNGHSGTNGGSSSQAGSKTPLGQTDAISPRHVPSESARHASQPTDQAEHVAPTAPSELSGGPMASSMFQSLVARLEVLRDMIGAASAHWIESSAPTVAHMSAYGVLSTAVGAASVHGKLSTAEATAMRDSILQGPLLESLRLALNPTLTQTRLLERIGALAASLVHGPSLLSALQALCVSLAQASHGSENDMRFMLKPLARTEPHAAPRPQTEPVAQPPALPHHMLAPPPPIMPLYQPPMPQMAPVHPMGHAYLPYGLPYPTQPQSQPPHAPSAPAPAHSPHGTLQASTQTPHIQTSQVQTSHVQTPQVQTTQVQTPQVQTSYARSPHAQSPPMQEPRTQAPHLQTQTRIETPRYQSFLPPSSEQPIGQLRHSIGQIDGEFRSRSPGNREFGSVSSVASSTSASTAASSVSFHVTGPDRLVTLQYNDKALQLTFSPMKATPPTISEIIDNARASFNIPAATVVRIKDASRNKIIETNSELIDAFTQAHVRLELLLPPPMMIGMDAKRDILGSETRFTNLAPIFRKSS